MKRKWKSNKMKLNENEKVMKRKWKSNEMKWKENKKIIKWNETRIKK